MRPRLCLSIALVAAITVAIPAWRVRRARQSASHAGCRGLRMAYAAHDPEGASHVDLMTVGGGPPVPVFESPHAVADIQWSPDGSRLACVLWMGPGHHSIVVVPAGGGGALGCTDPLGADDCPRWLPDSSRLAFISQRAGHPALYIMGADCTGQRRLTCGPHREQAPAWSPDGMRLAFQRALGRSEEVCVIHADGSGEQQLTRSQGFDGYPAWSPDGGHIAFASARTKGAGLYLMRPDGSRQRRLASVRGIVGSAWSPDGARIAFHGGLGSERGLWVVSTDGTGLRCLSAGPDLPDEPGPPTWLPGRGHIAFFGSAGRQRMSLYCLDAATGALDRIVEGIDPMASPHLLPSSRAMP